MLTEIFMADEKAYSEGIQAGKAEGLSRSSLNSFVDGFKNGFEICGEVQYYLSWAQTLNTLLWIAKSKDHKEGFPPNAKIKLALKELEKIIEIGKEWGDINEPMDMRLKEGIEKIHSKMFKVCSLLGIKTERNGKELEW